MWCEDIIHKAVNAGDGETYIAVDEDLVDFFPSEKTGDGSGIKESALRDSLLLNGLDIPE